MRSRVAAGALSFVLLFGASAHASDPDASAMAEALFDQGRALLDQGHVSEACDKFAASRKLDPAPGTTLNLADCYAKLGRTATAWGIFVDAEADARRDGDAPREREAHDRAAALADHVQRVKIAVDSPPAKSSLELDGTALSLAALEAPLPVDSGSHRVRISAPGFIPREVSFLIQPGTSETSVHLAPMRAAPPPPPPPILVPSPERVPFWSTPRVASAVSAAFTTACLGVGVGFGAAASSKWSSASSTCPGSSCADANARSEGRDAGKFADIATGAFIGAGVFAVAATVFFIVSPRASSSPKMNAAPGGVAVPFY